MKHKKVLRLLSLALALGLTVALITQAAPTEVKAASSAELQAQIDEMEERNRQLGEQIEALEQQKAENETEITALVARKNSLDQQIALQYAQIRNTDAQISAYTSLIADKQEELDAATAKQSELNEKYKERIRAMEEGGKLSYWSVLFKASSFSDFLDRLNMVQEIAASDQRRLEDLSRAAKDVAQAQEALTAEKEALEQTRAEQEQIKADLEAKIQESSDLLTELLSRGEEYEALIAAGQDAQNDLLSQIAQREAEYNQAKEAEWEAAHPTVPETEPPVTQPEDPDDPDDPTDPEPDPTQPEEPDNPPSSGGWIIPVDYVYVSSPFSDGRMHPILGYVRPHYGIDLAAYWGNPVWASRGGTVTVAEYDGECGNYVIINHGDGYSTGYLHLSSYTVSVGDTVSQGQVIGYVGSTGLSEGPHLHFSMIYQGSYVNPADYIDFY